MPNRFAKYIKEGNLGRIVLSRPKNNALNLETLEDLIALFQKSAENADICVIFTSEGKNFTVGADLKYIYSTFVEDKKSAELVTFSEKFQELTRAIMNHPGIIIVGFHGWVIGGGFELSLACDFRFASSDTQVMLPELSIGTMFSNASTKLLANIIGIGRAKELMLLGEKIDAETMLKFGLVSQITAPEKLDALLLQIANTIISKNDHSVIPIAKKLINENYDLDVETTLQKELAALIACGENETFRQKVKEFATNKR
ncbi:MAG: enoyl-CoA hydratase/isomerase family protein [Candidatus Heimdallarchaeota archaeon]